MLWGNTLRDLLIQMIEDGVFLGFVTTDILDEVFRNLATRLAIPTTRLDRTRALVEAALSDTFVQGYHHIAPELRLPDSHDHHVAQAAIAAEASLIVTFNGKDFPDIALSPYGVRAVHPDVWLCGLLERDEGGVLRALQTLSARRRQSPKTMEELTLALAKAGMPVFSARLMALVNTE